MGDSIFVCYSRKDEDFVLKLATNLKHKGAPIWLDQWDIPFGANWSRTIERALSECAHLLLVLSPSSVESDEVQSEWLSALDEKKVIVPILYRSCKIPFRLKLIQYIDFTSHGPEDESALGRVLGALGVTKSTLGTTVEQPERKQKEIFEGTSKGIFIINPIGKHDEAIKAYDRAIELNPKDAKAWYDKGLALRVQGKYDEAIKAYDRAIELNPKDVETWNEKGFVLNGLGKFDEAIQAVDTAIQLDPKHAGAWNNKGIALYNQGNYDKAIQAYDEAIQLHPNFAMAWMAWNNKGIALKACGKTTEANAAFDKAKKVGYT